MIKLLKIATINFLILILVMLFSVIILGLISLPIYWCYLSGYHWIGSIVVIIYVFGLCMLATWEDM
jgi:hypothetical protein